MTTRAGLLSQGRNTVLPDSATRLKSPRQQGQSQVWLIHCACSYCTPSAPKSRPPNHQQIAFLKCNAFLFKNRLSAELHTRSSGWHSRSFTSLSSHLFLSSDFSSSPPGKISPRQHHLLPVHGASASPVPSTCSSNLFPPLSCYPSSRSPP